ncbi:sulfotransferase family protein [Rubrobacter aplysinae]|uniref:sulfotransferase n=1 Tax=Rubrobacter aplysinae TaxID=909625 RepID=UPI001364B75B|nr:sulfotransferase [Rubrobacter aplysinae]
MPLAQESSPILVTGSHRSGSTWLANMLSLADNTLVAHEPFNIEPWAYSLDGMAEQWFTYAPALPQQAALKAFEKVLDRRARKVFLKGQPQHWLPPLRHGRLIVKDPIAALSSNWLASNFELELVVLIRHPAAFAASLKRLGWTHPFEHFLGQEMLMRDLLEPYRSKLTSAPDDVVEQAGIIWLCLYGVLSHYLEKNPGWLLKKHEDLSRDPIPQLKDLYEKLGLEWTAAVESKVKSYTRSANPVSAPEGTAHQLKRNSVANISEWQRSLSEKEVERVYELTHPVSDLYYPDEEWGY